MNILSLFEILCFLLMLKICKSFNYPGHGKPFGSNGPFLSLDHIEDLSTKNFFDNYVKPKIPVFIPNSVKQYPAFKLWTDEYLHKIAQDYKDYKLVIETKKKESRDQNIINLSLSEFLDNYKTKQIYMVNEVPFYLKKDVVLPQQLQCAQAPLVLEETMMWFSSGGTSSVTHTDDYENILCVFHGVKELILVDYFKNKEIADIIIDQTKGSFSSMDVDKVDYDQFPGLENLEYYHVNISAGDCLYIPYRWIHQVRSYDRNLAINFWFNYEKIFGNANFPDECSNNKLDLDKTLDKYNYTSNKNFFESFKFYIMRQVNLGYTKLDDWMNLILGIRDYEEDLKQRSEDLLRELFNLMDFNGNGELTDDEIIDLDENSLEHMAGLLDEIDSIFNNKESDSEESEDSNEDEEYLKNEL